MTANNPHEIAMRADAENRRLQAINADLLAALEAILKAQVYADGEGLVTVEHGLKDCAFGKDELNQALAAIAKAKE